MQGTEDVPWNKWFKTKDGKNSELKRIGDLKLYLTREWVFEPISKQS